MSEYVVCVVFILFCSIKLCWWMENFYWVWQKWAYASALRAQKGRHRNVPYRRQQSTHKISSVGFQMSQDVYQNRWLRYGPGRQTILVRARSHSYSNLPTAARREIQTRNVFVSPECPPFESFWLRKVRTSIPVQSLHWISAKTRKETATTRCSNSWLLKQCLSGVLITLRRRSVPT